MGNAQIDALRKHTMLCKVTASAFGMNRVDRSNSTPGAKVLVPLLPEYLNSHKAIVNAQVEARLALTRVSIPYGDEIGWRILPFKLLIKFAAGYKPAEERYKAAYNHLYAHIHTVIGGTPEVRDVDPQEILSAYSLKYCTNDYPEGSFEHAATPGHVQLLRKFFDVAMADVVKQSKADTVAMLRAPFEHMITRLGILDQRHAAINAEKDIGKTGVMRDNVLGHVQHAIEMVPLFNIMSDERINDLYEVSKPILGFVPDDLRMVKERRDEAMRIAELVVNSIDGFTP